MLHWWYHPKRFLSSASDNRYGDASGQQKCRLEFSQGRTKCMHKPRLANEADAQAVLCEAEALIEGDGAKPKE